MFALLSLALTVFAADPVPGYTPSADKATYTPAADTTGVDGAIVKINGKYTIDNPILGDFFVDPVYGPLVVKMSAVLDPAVKNTYSTMMIQPTNYNEGFSHEDCDLTVEIPDTEKQVSVTYVNGGKDGSKSLTSPITIKNVKRTTVPTLPCYIGLHKYSVGTFNVKYNLEFNGNAATDNTEDALKNFQRLIIGYDASADTQTITINSINFQTKVNFADWTLLNAEIRTSITTHVTVLIADALKAETAPYMLKIEDTKLFIKSGTPVTPTPEPEPDNAFGYTILALIAFFLALF
ncbi:hypothetical protein EIN_246920 [Entamoeba invadens IP1]|uniref:Uncharacterized protein n=1 Tax=Entamoeba invadens IP1 TaxID=370355 RepID=A0A0A1UE82_ENTIV|nr:hypothetical protein EIN_246920 [Entamoeba invadens IP1]ELP94798.1 hypothetical protein EIN_246920 [Entamoeba invadens IP1]|eukprot:XP_004261569.1 hypothetical protein EIN_246920 [Entamoeba invadens IP1]